MNLKDVVKLTKLKISITIFFVVLFIVVLFILVGSLSPLGIYLGVIWLILYFPVIYLRFQYAKMGITSYEPLLGGLTGGSGQTGLLDMTGTTILNWVTLLIWSYILSCIISWAILSISYIKNKKIESAKQSKSK